MEAQIQKKQSSRILALDVLRGITIAGMIMVNNPGSWGTLYEPLGHAAWNGLTPTDLVFPFFMFIMGISTYISMRKFNFEFSKDVLFKLIKRTIIIFMIGIGIAWLSLSFRTYSSLSEEGMGFFSRLIKACTNFENLRIMGVMQRLALTYCATSLFAIFLKHKYFPHVIIGGLFAYFLLLVFNNGFEQSENNIISIIDRAILGTNHMYKDAGLYIDPEGLLSTIPAIFHVMIGFYCGRYIVELKDNHQRIEKLFIVGTVMMFAGFLLSYGCPINKKIWSPTFVFATCGLGSLLLALLIWIIDIEGKKKWCVFFESFGVNPLFIYVFGGVLGILIGNIKIPWNDELISIKGLIYNNLFTPFFDPYLASFLFSILFVVVCWLVGHILYKRKTYIKI